MNTPTIHQRFFAKIAVCLHGPDCRECCWYWKTGTTSRGYGKFYLRSVKVSGQRRSVSIAAQNYLWVIVYGPLPARVYVTQTCGHKLCLNYHHLQTSKPVVVANIVAADIERKLESMRVHFNGQN